MVRSAGRSLERSSVPLPDTIGRSAPPPPRPPLQRTSARAASPSPSLLPSSAFAAGPGALYNVLIHEAIPAPLFPLAAPILSTSAGLATLTATALFPPLQHLFGSAVFCAFGGVAAALWFVLQVVLPETKGLTRGQITDKIATGSWFQGLSEA